MRIAYLSGSIIPSRNANSVHVMKMCQAFVKNGHQVVLYARQSEEPTKDEYVYYGVDRCFDIEKQHWPLIRGLGGIFYAIEVKRKIKKGSIPDLFYGRHLYGLLAVASLGYPLVYEAHNVPSSFLRKQLEAILLSRPNFRRLIVISDALKSEYMRQFPRLCESNVLVAHDGADDPGPYGEIDSDFTLPGRHHSIKVGYVGHLYPGRGVEIIIRLASLFPELDFHVVGGTEKDIEYWKSQAISPNLYFHGFVPHGLLKKYFVRFDILLAPYQGRVAVSGGKGDTSKWMSPLKIFEYMSYGKAIMASDLPVIKEVLRSGENCLLCPANDIEEWKKSLSLLADSQIMRKSLGDEARSQFLGKYTWLKRAENVLADTLSGC